MAVPCTTFLVVLTPATIVPLYSSQFLFLFLNLDSGLELGPRCHDIKFFSTYFRSPPLLRAL